MYKYMLCFRNREAATLNTASSAHTPGNEDIYRYRVHMHVRGQWGSKKNEMRCGDKFPAKRAPHRRQGLSRGFAHERGVLQNKYRGTAKSAAGSAAVARVLSFGALLADAATSCTLHNRKDE